MKIVYVLPTLEKKGGAERIITEKADYFAKVFGYEVFFVNLFQKESYSYYYPLSRQVQIINLGIPYHSQYRYKYPKRLWIKTKIKHRMRKLLSQAVDKINPDILIGVSFSQADLVCTIPCKAKIIIEAHEPRSLVTSDIYCGSLLSKIYSKKLYYQIIEKKADAIVTITPENEREWKKAKRVEVIPNFSSMNISQISTCKTKRVMAVGRLMQEKGFDRLIDSWKTVSERHPDWQLDIFGEGNLQSELSNQIETNHIPNVALRGATNDISKEYATSSVCVVTSYYEGFSLVLLEALKHGVPCVAYDCPFGPRHIIENGKCGFLVEDGNKDQFIDKLCTLIEDEQLRQQFSKAALQRATIFDTDEIMKKWKELFESLVQNNS